MVRHLQTLATPIISSAFKPLLTTMPIIPASAAATTSIAMYLSKNPKIPAFLDTGAMAFLLSSIAANVLPFPQLRDPVAKSGLMKVAWTHFLQGALILGIFGATSSSSDVSESNSSTDTLLQSKSLIPVLVTFILGALGSFMGGILGFSYAKSSQTIGKYDLATVISCLVASYIGGSANFFEVASFLGKDASPSLPGIVTLVAGLDIGIMVVYFSILLSLRQCKSVISFLSGTKIEDDGSKVGGLPQDKLIKETSVTTPHEQKGSLETTHKFNVAFLIEKMRLLKPLGIAFTISSFSLWMQSLVPHLPGVSVMICTLLSILFKKLSPATFDLALGGIAGEGCMTLFYSTLGQSLILSDLLGASFLSLIALVMCSMLSIHLITILIGSALWNRLGQNKSPYKVNIDDVILASNALVGGAGTAAAMASSMKRPDLVVLGSSFGILGYLIGTQSGLLAFRFIKTMLTK